MATWLRFEQFRDDGRDDEPIIFCDLGKVFQFSESRKRGGGTQARAAASA
jgi:hypothetical protein